MKFKLINILDSVNALQKVQGHSRQRHCLILNLKESKFAEFFISRGIALYGIEFRPYLSVLGRSVTKRLQCRVLHRCFETGCTSFIMSGESPFRIFNPSLENVSAIREEISLVKSRSCSYLS